MCQSIANGGWRCATHEPGNNAMASWARSSSGVPLSEARHVFMDLKDEGEGSAAPSQDEVVEFLTTQEFHVRHADALPTDRKAQILGQLRTALKRAWQSILPDGATFHAWKNVTGECWSRAKRKMAASLMLGGLTAASLTGCGGSQADAARITTPTPSLTTSSAAVTPGPAASAHQRTVMKLSDPQFAAHTITGPGAVAFGASDARVAYQVAVLFTMNQGVDGPALTSTGSITDAILAPAKAAMTPNAFADLKAYADKANAGDEESKNQLGLIVATDLVRGGDNLTYRNDTAPVVSRKTFGPAGSTVAGKNLGVQFTAVTDYRLLNDKKQPITAHLTREVSYAMAKAGSKWLIDGWTVNAKVTFANG